jgi:DNA-binding transcriptional ArsR family regulator
VIDEVFHPAVEDVPLSKVLASLADPARLAIVRALARADEGLACTLLPEETGLALSRSTMSHHQRNLREAGVTLTRIYGNRRVLRLRREELDQRFPGLLAAILAAPDQSAEPLAADRAPALSRP